MMKKEYLNKIVTLVLFVLAILLTQSCLVTKEYQRPANVVDEHLYRKTEVSPDTAGIANKAWREYFKDPNLVQHIETGLAYNNDYRIAAQQLLIAQAGLKQAKASYAPTVSVQTQWNKVVDGPASDFYDLSANLSWEADIWGKITAGKNAAIANILLTVENQNALKSMLIAQIATSYLQLLSLDEQLETTKKTIEIRREQLKTLTALKDAGMVNEVSIQQSNSQLFTALGLKEEIEKQIFVQENALSILLGQTPGSIERGTLKAFTMYAVTNTGVPAQLLANRPDVKAAEYSLVQAFEMSNVARTEFYPALRIGASGGYNAQKISDWFNPGSAFFNVLSSLTQPVFNQRRLKTDLEVAKLNQEQALIRFEEQLLVAGQEVSDALFEIENTNRQYEIKVKKLEADNKALEVSEQLLNQGLINYLDVLVAQESKLNTELELINLSGLKWRSRIQLYRALGGGAM